MREWKLGRAAAIALVVVASGAAAGRRANRPDPRRHRGAPRCAAAGRRGGGPRAARGDAEADRGVAGCLERVARTWRGDRALVHARRTCLAGGAPCSGAPDRLSAGSRVATGGLPCDGDAVAGAHQRVDSRCRRARHAVRRRRAPARVALGPRPGSHPRRSRGRDRAAVRHPRSPARIPPAGQLVRRLGRAAVRSVHPRAGAVRQQQRRGHSAPGQPREPALHAPARRDEPPDQRELRALRHGLLAVDAGGVRSRTTAHAARRSWIAWMRSSATCRGSTRSSSPAGIPATTRRSS